MPPENHTRLFLSDRRFQAVLSVTLVGILGIISISPALGLIARRFELDSARAALVMTVFTLPGIFLAPLLGMLSDLWGRRRVLVPALFLFGAAGTACFFVRTFQELLFLRFLQGCGGASLAGLALTLIGDLYDGKRRAHAMGLNEAGLGIGTTLFPVLGGAAATAAWNYPFLLSLLALPSAFFVAIHYREQSRQGPPFNRAEYLAAAVRDLTHPGVLLFFAGLGLVFLLIYSVSVTALPLWMSAKFGASPLVIGGFLTLMAVCTASTAFNLGALLRIAGSETMVKAGFFLFALACSLYPLCPSAGWILIPVLFMGIANGLMIPNLQVLLADAAPGHSRGALMSLIGVAVCTGQTLGPLWGGFLFNWAGPRGAFFGGMLLGAAGFLTLHRLRRSGPFQALR